MTLLTIRNQLVGHFCESEVFTEEDFDTIRVPNKLSQYHCSLVTAGLSSLIKQGMIDEVIPGKLWALNAPLTAKPQTVAISAPVASEIANVINDNLKSKGIDDEVDALNIQEGHIVALIAIIDELINQE